MTCTDLRQHFTHHETAAGGVFVDGGLDLPFLKCVCYYFSYQMEWRIIGSSDETSAIWVESCGGRHRTKLKIIDFLFSFIFTILKNLGLLDQDSSRPSNFLQGFDVELLNSMSHGGFANQDCSLS